MHTQGLQDYSQISRRRSEWAGREQPTPYASVHVSHRMEYHNGGKHSPKLYIELRTLNTVNCTMRSTFMWSTKNKAVLVFPVDIPKVLMRRSLFRKGTDQHWSFFEFRRAYDTTIIHKWYFQIFMFIKIASLGFLINFLSISSLELTYFYLFIYCSLVQDLLGRKDFHVLKHRDT